MDLIAAASPAGLVTGANLNVTVSPTRRTES